MKSKRNVLVLDKKTAAMIKTWRKIEAMLRDPRLRDTEWTSSQECYTACWLYGEAKEKIGERVLALFDCQSRT